MSTWEEAPDSADYQDAYQQRAVGTGPPEDGAVQRTAAGGSPVVRIGWFVMARISEEQRAECDLMKQRLRIASDGALVRRALAELGARTAPEEG